MKLLFKGIALLAMCGSLSAGTILDGIISPGEYTYITTLKPYVNGSNASGGVQNVALYWTTDANFVYGAVIGDLNQPFAAFANIYVYSSGASHQTGTGNPGVYGDGNDVLIEGTTNWGFVDPSGMIAGTRHFFTPTTTGGLTSASLAGVSFAYAPSTLTEEFQIDKSLLGSYDVLRFGGQLFAFEFNTGSSNRVPGALVEETSAPEPSTWMLLAGAFSILPFLRKKRV